MNHTRTFLGAGWEGSTPVYAYESDTHKFIKKYDSIAKAGKGLLLPHMSCAHFCVDKVNKNGKRKTSKSRLVNKRIYLTTTPIDTPNTIPDAKA